MWEKVGLMEHHIGTLVKASEKGYINKELFHEFGKSFLSSLHQQDMLDQKPHILLMDSHYSHLYNIEFLELMKSNNIHVFALPPGCNLWTEACSEASKLHGMRK